MNTPIQAPTPQPQLMNAYLTVTGLQKFLQSPDHGLTDDQFNAISELQLQIADSMVAMPANTPYDLIVKILGQIAPFIADEADHPQRLALWDEARAMVGDAA